MNLAILFPSRLRMDWVIAGALTLLLLQIFSGTGILFAQLVFIFVVIAAVTVNLLGGLKTIAGFCASVIALKLVVVSQIIKVCFWEPAERNLESPMVTIQALTLGMASVMCAALLVRAVRVRRTVFKPDTDLSFLRAATIFCIVVFLISSPGYLVMGTGEGFIRIGGISGLFKRLSPCGGLAVILGTAHTILSSGGNRCVSWLNGLPMLVMFALGIYGASKEGMLSPLLSFVLTAAAFGFRVRPIHLLGLVSFMVVFQFVLFPFGQVARHRIRGHGFGDTLVELRAFFSDHFQSWKGIQALYTQEKRAAEEDIENQYFDHSIATLERVALIKPSDSLIAATVAKGPSRWETITPGFESLLPAAIFRRAYKDPSNELGVKARIISEENEGTSIAFGFVADAFSAFEWIGVVVIPFLLCLLFFFVTRALTTEMPQNVWWAYFCSLYLHQVSEYNISGLFTLSTYQNLWYIAPALGIVWSARWASRRGLFRGRSLEIAPTTRSVVSIP